MDRGAWQATVHGVTKWVRQDLVTITKTTDLDKISWRGKCLGVCVCMLSHVWTLFATPWTVALQAPMSMVFSKQEYWSELPFPSPWDLPNDTDNELMPPAVAGRFFYHWATWEAQKIKNKVSPQNEIKWRVKMMREKWRKRTIVRQHIYRWSSHLK